MSPFCFTESFLLADDSYLPKSFPSHYNKSRLRQSLSLIEPAFIIICSKPGRFCQYKSSTVFSFSGKSGAALFIPQRMLTVSPHRQLRSVTCYLSLSFNLKSALLSASSALATSIEPSEPESLLSARIRASSARFLSISSGHSATSARMVT